MERRLYILEHGCAPSPREDDSSDSDESPDKSDEERGDTIWNKGKGGDNEDAYADDSDNDTAGDQSNKGLRSTDDRDPRNKTANGVCTGTDDEARTTTGRPSGQRVYEFSSHTLDEVGSPLHCDFPSEPGPLHLGQTLNELRLMPGSNLVDDRHGGHNIATARSEAADDEGREGSPRRCDEVPANAAGGEGTAVVRGGRKQLPLPIIDTLQDPDVDAAGLMGNVGYEQGEGEGGNNMPAHAEDIQLTGQEYEDESDEDEVDESEQGEEESPDIRSEDFHVPGGKDTAGHGRPAATATGAMQYVHAFVGQLASRLLRQRLSGCRCDWVPPWFQLAAS
ncbi:hypothetical protein LXA43DRAFT_1064241 [Ganoderma leucocontextum]|nr:hypothetical protein LXA43DRAFT_1064241 [Ganoderma leucocontextum]